MTNCGLRPTGASAPEGLSFSGYEGYGLLVAGCTRQPWIGVTDSPEFVMPDLIRHPQTRGLKQHWIPGQAWNDKLDTYDYSDIQNP
jgi:hypothetical protein